MSIPCETLRSFASLFQRCSWFVWLTQPVVSSKDIKSFDRQEVYMKRALTVPRLSSILQPFSGLELFVFAFSSCTWHLLISLHVDLQGFFVAFLAHILIFDVHSRCFPIAYPALCRCHGHLCFSHACRRQEPQEPLATNFKIYIRLAFAWCSLKCFQLFLFPSELFCVVDFAQSFHGFFHDSV